MTIAGAESPWLASAATWVLLGGILLLAYIKLSVVLAALRRGLGGVPPATLTALLALLLSGLAMAPLADRSYRAMAAVPTATDSTVRIAAGLLPLRQFLTSHTAPRELAAVKDLVRSLQPATAPAALTELPTELAAFALGELRLAFQFAFVLLLPFLLIDLLCASLLSGLLLSGLSATAVALPFKLLLFVVCDGWQLLCRGLLAGYGGSP
jgi:type III secretion protein R